MIQLYDYSIQSREVWFCHKGIDYAEPGGTKCPMHPPFKDFQILDCRVALQLEVGGCTRVQARIRSITYADGAKIKCRWQCKFCDNYNFNNNDNYNNNDAPPPSPRHRSLTAPPPPTYRAPKSVTPQPPPSTKSLRGRSKVKNFKSLRDNKYKSLRDNKYKSLRANYRGRGKKHSGYNNNGGRDKKNGVFNNNDDKYKSSGNKNKHGIFNDTESCYSLATAVGPPSDINAPSYISYSDQQRKNGNPYDYVEYSEEDEDDDDELEIASNIDDLEINQPFKIR